MPQNAPERPKKAGLVTVKEITRRWGVDVATVRFWVSKGVLNPVRRQGPGPRATMLFAPGQVVNLLFALCPICGVKFKKGRLSKEYCSAVCRKRAHRIRGGHRYPAPSPAPPWFRNEYSVLTAGAIYRHDRGPDRGWQN